MASSAPGLLGEHRGVFQERWPGRPPARVDGNRRGQISVGQRAHGPRRVRGSGHFCVTEGPYDTQPAAPSRRRSVVEHHLLTRPVNAAPGRCRRHRRNMPAPGFHHRLHVRDAHHVLRERFARKKPERPTQVVHDQDHVARRSSARTTRRGSGRGPRRCRRAGRPGGLAIPTRSGAQAAAQRRERCGMTFPHSRTRLDWRAEGRWAPRTRYRPSSSPLSSNAGAFAWMRIERAVHADHRCVHQSLLLAAVP